jgi:hypothetical protein
VHTNNAADSLLLYAAALALLHIFLLSSIALVPGPTHVSNLDNLNPSKQIYTQLTGVMSKAFFPGSDPAVQALSIWGIFAGELQQLSYHTSWDGDLELPALQKDAY